MSFEEARQRYQALRGQRDAGAFDDAQLAAAVAELRVQDARGEWWTIDAASGEWLRWDGTAWAPGSPPLPAQAPDAGSGAWTQLQQRTVDPQEFLRQAREVPWSRRSQGWWDLLAILGGAVSGWLWFVYSGVRGFPLPQLLAGMPLLAQAFDFFKTTTLLGLPVVLFLLRRPLAVLLQPVSSAIGKLPTLLKLAVAGTALVPVLVLYLWASFDPWIYPRLFASREGVDLITPLLMLAIPLGLVWFRRETDAVLRPFQPIRQLVPRLLLVGAGLFAPFVVATLLYGIGMLCPIPLLRGFFMQYPYLRLSVLLGTLVSYVILRTPKGGAAPASGFVATAARLGALTALAFLVGDGFALADDFLRDPFNLNDGLRTPTFAPIIAGAATTVVTVLVNGAEVVQVIIQGAAPPGYEGPPIRKDFLVVVDTVDAAGATSMDLAYETSPVIFIYAHCEEVGKGRFPAGDPTIRFAPQFDTAWAELDDLGMANGRRCARVSLCPPRPPLAPPATLVVLVSAGQAVAGVPVTLRLGAPEYVLELR